MGKIGSFFLGLLAGLLTGVVLAVLVVALSTRWTVGQPTAFQSTANFQPYA